MKLIGLCGMSGSGKTLVGSLFATEGFLHVDCDKLVHERVYAREDVRAALAKAFGADVVAGGVVRSREIGRIVFADPEKLQMLNDLLRPFIRAELFSYLAEHKSDTALLDAPTLFEAGIDKDCTFVVALIAPRMTCIERIMSRDGITREQAEARLSRQKDETFLRAHCDYVLVNDGNIVKLTKEVLRLAEKLKKE